MVDSANALLNYIPIFLILFALIAILEDSGYMARIAFIGDVCRRRGEQCECRLHPCSACVRQPCHFPNGNKLAEWYSIRIAVYRTTCLH
ncbi:MAG: hypothetical protein PVI54_04165, partial [Desulfobacteraceae bacterium]